MTQIPYIEYLYIAAIATLLFFLLKISYKQYKQKRAAQKRFKRGAKLEKRGRDFLIKQGFKVEHEQYLAHHTLYVDNKKESIGIIPDYIVSKDGKTYIVDVKTGHSAISIKDKSTRRQLLEYDHAIPNDGIYILDMENLQLKRIAFQSWRATEQTSNTRVPGKNQKPLIAVLTLIIILLIITISTLI